jgi:glycosyltransferase involved in cell wall biosynthesis
MKVCVIGTRGFPYVQGGVERHCEILYPIIVRKGHSAYVFRKRPYINKRNTSQIFQGVKFCDLWTTRRKSLETIIHSFLASLVCFYKRPDIVHIHNVGPSLVMPLLKLWRLNTVVTYHSANYEHSKWGCFAKKMLKLGEAFMIRWADKVVFVAKDRYDSTKCRKKIHIPNGVNIVQPTSSHDFLSKVGVFPGRYILAVGRFTPEKGLHDLIKAFKCMNSTYKLVIAGDADHETEYSKNLRQMARDDRIILAGYITGEPLNQLYSHACLFVLPSYHEGMPIVLLEAMSYGLPVLVSDIPANKEIELPDERYFRCGDVDDLKDRMVVLLENSLSEKERQDIRKQIVEKYNWDKIAEQTIKVYEEVLNKRN